MSINPITNKPMIDNPLNPITDNPLNPMTDNPLNPMIDNPITDNPIMTDNPIKPITNNPIATNYTYNTNTLPNQIPDITTTHISSTFHGAPRLYPEISPQEASPLSTSHINSTRFGHQQPIQTTAPIPNPISFRKNQDRSIPYQPSIYVNEPLIFTHGELDKLITSFSHSLAGFDPWNINLTHPIHYELKQICTRMLISCKEFTLEKKIYCLNVAISQIVRNHFADILLRDSFTAEILEISLRNHLYRGLLNQEQDAVKKFYKSNKKFPNDLAQKEALLYSFSTKDDFYLCPEFNVTQYLIGWIAETGLMASCIEKTAMSFPLANALKKNEAVVVNQLKELQLSEPSQCSLSFEFCLLQGMTCKIITKLAEYYRNEFQRSGSIDQQQFQADCKNLEAFYTANSKFPSKMNIVLELIGHTFELSRNTPNPFEIIQRKVNQEISDQYATLYSEKKSLLGRIKDTFTSKKAKENRIQELGEKKITTMKWAKEEWN